MSTLRLEHKKGDALFGCVAKVVFAHMEECLLLSGGFAFGVHCQSPFHIECVVVRRGLDAQRIPAFSAVFSNFIESGSIRSLTRNILGFE